MGLLDKLFRRNSAAEHEQWLKDHPEKNRPPSAAVEDKAEHQRMRERMEKEMADQNAKRNE